MLIDSGDRGEVEFVHVFGSMGRTNSLITALGMMLHAIPQDRLDGGRSKALSAVLGSLEDEVNASRRMLRKMAEIHAPEQVAGWVEFDEVDAADAARTTRESRFGR